MAERKDRSQRHRRTHNLKPVAITTQKPPELPAGTHLELAGYAVLGKDDITQLPMWFTYDAKGEDHVNLSPGQPLLFPGRKFEVGARVDLLVPVKDDNTH